MSAFWRCPGCPEPPHWGADAAGLRDRFPWVAPLADCPQDPTYHAEGDVLTHLGMVLTELAALPAFRALPEPDRHLVWAATLLHDVAKPDCTRTDDDGRIRSPGHAVKGVYKARRILAEHPSFDGGPPFAAREQILALVRWHGLPATYLEKADPLRAVVLAAVTTRLDLAWVLADADHRGRVCTEPGNDTHDRITLFPDFCREAECWAGPRAFASDHSRFVYFRIPTAHPTLSVYDDCRCEVTILSGLPGSGKDTWAKAHAAGREVIALDDIRVELDVDPGDDQGAVVAAAYDRARAALRAGRPFVWNATNVSRVLRGKLIDLCADYRARVRVVYLEPPLAVVRARNTGRERAVPRRVWDRMLDRLDVPSLAEAHAVEYGVGPAS